MKKKFSAGLAAFFAFLAYWIVNIPDGGQKPTPTPTATATATPEPSPSPSLTPLPTPPLAYLCKLPPQTLPSTCIDNPSDDQDRPWFMDALMSAQDSAEENGFVKDGLVVDDVAYMNEVVRILRVSGYCAMNGREGGHTSDDEVWIRNSGSFSENYDIITSRHEPWTKYAAKCVPSKF